MTQRDQTIPDFLENDEQPADNQPLVETPHPLQKTMLILAIFWFLTIVLYLHFFYGWTSLSALMPADFVLFLAALIICPLIIFLLIVYLKKVYSSLKQNEVVEHTLNRFLMTKDENLLSKIINKALQSQIAELNTTIQFLSAQTDTLKKELETKADDFSNISQTLQTTFKQNMLHLDDNKTAFLELCRALSKEALEASNKLRQNTEDLQKGSDALYQKLNPLIDETMVTVDHLKNTVEDAAKQISHTKSDLNIFTDMGKKSMEDLAQMLQIQTAKFEKAMLNTADNCEDIYNKIDAGISHIENSLQTHKNLASEQAALIDKNAAFLDGKLGQYGKLISMEAAAMVEQASNFDLNVQNQTQKLQQASRQIEEILGGANNSLSLKSAEAVQNIERVLSGLSQEVQKLSDFALYTEKQNNQVETVAEKISAKIASISSDLGVRVDDLRLRSVEAIDKLNEVSAVIEKNALQLSENTTVMLSKGKEGSDVIKSQQTAIYTASQTLSDMKKQIENIAAQLATTQQKSVQVFDDFKTQMTSYQQVFAEQFSQMDNLKKQTEQQLEEAKIKYQEIGLTSFMNEISTMIENLENLSIDINRFFDKDSEDELWKKFYNGDHGAFAHNIVKKLGRKEVVKIREQYENDADFREITDRYLAQFNALLTSAEHSQNPKTVLAMMSSSEVGKIYYIMARALDKLG